MSNQFGINVGKLYSDIENIKGARTRNKLATLQLAEAERIPQQREQEALRQNKLAGLRTDIVGGEPQQVEMATKQLLAIDPVEGGKFLDTVAKMDSRKLKIAQQNVEEMGKMASFVLTGQTPEEQNRRYMMMRENLPKATLANLPEKYDPNFMEVSLAKAQSMASILENPKAIRVGGEDVIFKGGREVERATRPIKETKTGAGAGLKSADESFISREVTQLLGGFYDPATGEFRGLDKSLLSKAQGIKTEAAKLFIEGGGKISRSEAVKKAARMFGEQVLDPNNESVNKFEKYLR